MLFKVSEIAPELGLSKVSVYNKISSLQNELKPYIRHKKGVMFIDDEGLLILKKSFGLINDVETEKETAADKASMPETPKTLNDIETLNKSVEMLKNLLNNSVNSINSEYIQTLKDQVSHLQQELEKKNEQLSAKDELLKNFQVMLQTEKQSRLQLEQSQTERDRHFTEFISEWRQEHAPQPKQKGFFSKLFNK